MGACPLSIALFQSEYSLRASSIRLASQTHPSSFELSSSKHSKASPTIGFEKCFFASKRAVLMFINLASYRKVVQDPVVKS